MEILTCLAVGCWLPDRPHWKDPISFPHTTAGCRQAMPAVLPYLSSSIQAMFGDGSSSVIRGKKELVLLLKTLTTFVPHDPLFALKVHLPPLSGGEGTSCCRHMWLIHLAG